MHPRLTELLDYLDVTRASVLGAASMVPRERWGVRPAPDRWSVAEICWHLQRVESGVAKLIRKRASEARAAGHPEEPADSPLRGTRDRFGLVDRTRRLEAPSSVAPPESLPAGDAQRLLEESRTMLRAAIAEADGLALGLIMHPHPVVGEINLYDWILFVGLHEQRHLQQIGEVAAASTN
ncbi:DinB family protein [soil metagenome]